MQFERPISTLLQLQIPANIPGNTQRLGRIVVSGNIMVSQRVHTAVSDVTIDVTDDPVYEDPPNKILDALGKLTLYRMQERANKEVENGNIREATQQLQNLATRLIEVGQDELAKEAFEEAKRLEATQALSEEGRKTLKYQTRLLINQGD
jgi:Ca-activated chloride channel family protein